MKKVSEMSFEEQAEYVDQKVGDLMGSKSEYYVPKIALFLEKILNQQMHCLECDTHVELINGNLICLHKRKSNEHN